MTGLLPFSLGLRNPGTVRVPAWGQLRHKVTSFLPKIHSSLLSQGESNRMECPLISSSVGTLEPPLSSLFIS